MKTKQKQWSKWVNDPYDMGTDGNENGWGGKGRREGVVICTMGVQWMGGIETKICKLTSNCNPVLLYAFSGTSWWKCVLWLLMITLM